MTEGAVDAADRAGWITGEDGVAYPPAPWHLDADFGVTVFLVRRDALPPDVRAHAPAGARLLRLGAHAIVGVAAVRYGGGGVLAYDELLVALPVWHRRAVRVSIAQIWVDSPASRAGGRQLWGIPKQLMTVSRHARAGRLDATYTDAAGVRLATITARSILGLPGRWPLPLPTAQRLTELGVEDVVACNRLHAGIHPIRARWRFEGPLSWLTSARPILRVGLSRADIVFGER